MSTTSNSKKTKWDGIIPYIFCAGAGTRMLPYSEHVPKVLLPFKDGSCTLYHIAKSLAEIGFKNAIANYSYGQDLFEEMTGVIQRKLGFRISLVEESRPLGHVGGLKNAEATITEEIILGLNGDTISRFEVDIMREFLSICTKESPFVAWVRKNNEKNFIRVNNKGHILGVGKWNFQEGIVDNEYDSCGVFALRRDTLDLVDSLEFFGFFGDDDLVERIVETGKQGIVFLSPRELEQISVGTKEEYLELLERGFYEP